MLLSVGNESFIFCFYERYIGPTIRGGVFLFYGEYFILAGRLTVNHTITLLQEEIYMKKRILSLVLALAMLSGLTACGGGGDKTPDTSAQAQTEASAQDETEASAQDESTSGDDYYPVTVEVYNSAKELVPYTFEKCPERTLIYGRNNVEIMLALGLADKILMITDCGSVKPEYQAEFEKLDQLQNHQDVSYFVREYALSLNPDMVIGWRSLFDMEDRMGDVSFWHERNIGTYTSTNSVLKDNQSLENEYADIRNLAKIYNKQEKAEEIISEIQAGVDKGKEAAKGKEAQRILIAEKWEGEYDIYHAKSAIGDIAAQLGAEPLGEAGWTDEQIVAANPEAIFAVHVGSVTDEEAIALYTENPALASVDAVKNNRVYPVEYSLAYTPGVRTIDTVKMFLKNLYSIEY